MPVRNCCLGCQGPMAGPCGALAYRKECCGNDVGPCCVHSFGCSSCGVNGVLHGARGGVAGSYYSCGAGCIGGCTGSLCGCCCGPAC